VPVGHWMCGGVQPGEPYIGGELPYLLRFLGWWETRVLTLSFFLNQLSQQHNMKYFLHLMEKVSEGRSWGMVRPSYCSQVSEWFRQQWSLGKHFLGFR